MKGSEGRGRGCEMSDELFDYEIREKEPRSGEGGGGKGGVETR